MYLETKITLWYEKTRYQRNPSISDTGSLKQHMYRCINYQRKFQ